MGKQHKPTSNNMAKILLTPSSKNNRSEENMDACIHISRIMSESRYDYDYDRECGVVPLASDFGVLFLDGAAGILKAKCITRQHLHVSTTACENNSRAKLLTN